MRIRAFSTGRVRPKRGASGVRRYLPGGWSRKTFPVNVFLVEHPPASACSTPVSARMRPSRATFRTDHVGGVKDFAGSEIVVNRPEWARASGLRGRVRGYLPQ